MQFVVFSYSSILEVFKYSSRGADSAYIRIAPGKEARDCDPRSRS